MIQWTICTLRLEYEVERTKEYNTEEDAKGSDTQTPEPIKKVFDLYHMNDLPKSRIISKKLKETALRQHSAKSD